MKTGGRSEDIRVCNVCLPSYQYVVGSDLDKGDPEYFSGHGLEDFKTQIKLSTAFQDQVIDFHVIDLLGYDPSLSVSNRSRYRYTFQTSGYGALRAGIISDYRPLRPAGHYDISLRTSSGKYWSAEEGGGGIVNANRSNRAAWESFYLVDLIANGGLRSGDAVNIQASNNWYVSAENGGGQMLNANRHDPRDWERFTIVKVSGSSGDPWIRGGDRIALRTFNGAYVVVPSNEGLVQSHNSAIGE